MFKGLPQRLKPANKASVTLSEKAKMLSWGVPDFLMKYYKELNQFVPEVEKEMLSTHDQKTQVEFAYSIGRFYVTSLQYRKAFDYYKKVITYAREDTAYKKTLCECYSVLASLYSSANRSDTAMMLLEKALKFTDQKDSVSLCNVYGAYALIYNTLNLYSSSIYYNQKFIELLPSSNKRQGDGLVSLIQIAVLYGSEFRDTHDRKYFDSAKVFANQALEEGKKWPQYWYAGAYYSLGCLYMWDKQYQQAVTYFDSSLLPKYIAQTLTDGLPATAEIYRATCLVNLGNKEAVALLDTMKIDTTDIIMQQMRSKALYEYDKRTGNWRSALKNYEAYKKYTDSLKIIANQAVVFEANQKYSVAKKDVEIKTLENKALIEKQGRIKILVGAAIAIILLFVIIVLLYAKSKKNEAERIKEQERMVNELQLMEQERELSFLQQQAEKEAAIISERKAISQNMHDEISSSLTGLNYLITHVKRNMSRQGAVPVEMLEEVEEEARAVYRQARDFMHALNRNAITESYNLVELLHKLEERFDQQYGLKINVEMNDDDVNTYFKSEQHAEMYRVVKEAVTNSIKHSGADVITIRIKKEKDYFYFDISDNGHGIEPSQSAGMGMATMKQRIEALSGNMRVQSDNAGTHITGTFPVSIA